MKLQKSGQYPWIVVGGGLQGCYFAGLLTARYGRVAILDAQPYLLQRWLVRSRACRMRFMRSTSVHHLAPEPSDLRHFAKRNGYGKEHFTQPYLRPSLALFNAHSQDVLRRFRLTECHIRGRLCGLKPPNSQKLENGKKKLESGSNNRNGWELNCVAQNISEHGEKKSYDGSFTLYAQNVLLALGDQGEYWPEEYQAKPEDNFQGNLTEYRNGQNALWHLSAPDFSLPRLCEQIADYQAQAGRKRAADLCLVGGGISSAQLALYFLERGFRVQIEGQYPLHSFQFDSEPGWLQQYLLPFQAETDLQKRWKIIAQERHKGSVPPQLCKRLLAYQKTGQILFDSSEAPQRPPTVLATGLEFSTPAWLLELAREQQLPLMRPHEGMGQKPALYSSLEWHSERASGLFLGGRLGELFLGPAAGNIAGARVAARYLPL